MNDYLDFYKMNHKDLIEMRSGIMSLISEYKVMRSLKNGYSLEYLDERIDELNKLLERTNWDKIEMIKS